MGRPTSRRENPAHSVHKTCYSVLQDQLVETELNRQSSLLVLYPIPDTPCMALTDIGVVSGVNVCIYAIHGVSGSWVLLELNTDVVSF